jgi:sirohydrochlorin ferrochelatase
VAPSLAVGRLFGQSYFAVEVLADRFRAIHEPAGRDVIVVGHGATDADSRQRMEADWQRLAELAAQGFGFKSVRALVWPKRSSPQNPDAESDVKHAFVEAAKAGERVAVVPFALGPKLDSMMNFTATLQSQLPAGAELIDGDITPHPAVSTWMAREWNRGVPLRPEDLGIVFLAHGSDFHWNETMRETIAPLSERYKIEFAFSMADQPSVERAVRRLEQRGASAIAVVRVFGLAASFKSDVEHMIGQDVENALLSPPAAAPTPAGHDHGQHAHHGSSAVEDHSAHSHGDHHGHAAGPSPRIRSTALLATVGGMEDHRYFAAALLERAKALSKEPARETVILVAHGDGDDSINDHWRHLLESLAQQMRASGGADFRAIKTGTWREDWPDKRAPEVAAIRALVEDATRDGGRALVIPARMQGQGDERELLKGLTFELGTGFSPHPLFARWVEEKIREGVAALEATKTPVGTASRAAPATAAADSPQRPPAHATSGPRLQH